MPANFLQADTGFPDLSRYDTTEQKLEALQNYLFLLLENLRYTLRNLSMDNFNSTALNEWVDGLDIKANNIDAHTIISNTFITNELYTKYGQIADLTVDKLRTDYKKAQRYLSGDTSNLDYLYIHDEEISFITASTDGTQTEQMSVDGKLFYWTDEGMTQMTSEEVTEWPVMIYVYTELVKGSFRFGLVPYTEDTLNRVPEIVMGAGYGKANPDWGKGFIRKNKTTFDMWFIGGDGTENGVYIGEKYTDITGLRRATALNFGNWEGGSFLVTLEGKTDPTMYGVTLDDNGRPVSILYPDGESCAITWG